MEFTKEQKEKRLLTILSNMAYQEELECRNKTLTKEEKTTGFNEIKEYLKAKIDIPQFILNNDEFIQCLTTIFYKNNTFNINDLEHKDVIERYNWYVEGFNFFNDENAFNILDEYGVIVDKDKEGFYKLNDVIVDKILLDNEFNITDDKKEIKSVIYNTWENHKELLTSDNINKSSEQRNGINFKHFIFCEEYIKRGKIKPTCDYLGISRNTAYLWLKDEKVQQYLNERQEEIKRDTDNTFKQTYNECFNVLCNMINSTFIQNDTRVKAISTFLRHYENMQRVNNPGLKEE